MDLLNQITREELEKLENALALITVLIAGADGKVDAKELSWAKKLAVIRSYFGPDELHPMYKDVANNLLENVNRLLDELPGDVDRRTEELKKRLTELNPILKKVDPLVGKHLYKSMRTFAKKVAKSSGGFLGVFSISAEEQKLIGLDMLDPIE